MPIRVCAYIDGFNLYHAVDDLGKNHLKWLDLRKLMGRFTDPNVHDIVSVYYFSAYATWLPGPFSRHQQYVAALAATGTTPVMGQFKEKNRSCKRCDANWTGHEEKESDVNIAIRMLMGAVDDEYDQAFLVTGDSDLAEPCRVIRNRFPKKKIKLLIPPKRRHSKELWGLVDKRGAIKEAHIEQSLFGPKVLNNPGDGVAATRPVEYNPPT